MGRLQKAMSFLGLADDDYDDFEPYDEPIPSFRFKWLPAAK